MAAMVAPCERWGSEALWPASIGYDRSSWARAELCAPYAFDGRPDAQAFWVRHMARLAAILTRSGPNYLKLAMSIVLPSSSSIQTSRRPYFAGPHTFRRPFAAYAINGINRLIVGISRFYEPTHMHVLRLDTLDGCHVHLCGQ